VGLPVLAAVLYFGLYRFVGGFGAGVLVDTLDRVLFLDRLNPWLDRTVDALFAGDLWRELLAHEYGVLTLGLRYAVAIVLPIVGTFFVCFAVLEDSGYLPRLALLADRLLKPLGLSGRALIPLTLGLGCGTMATLVTRTLETRRERVLATFLLALGVPCSAQLGVVMGVLAERPGALALWAMCVAGALVAGGTLAARLLPGRAAPFFMEVPPLRFPHPRNVWKKTTARMVWYFREILPVFLAASVVIWLGRLAGLFPVALSTLARLCRWMGPLPVDGPAERDGRGLPLRVPAARLRGGRSLRPGAGSSDPVTGRGGGDPDSLRPVPGPNRAHVSGAGCRNGDRNPGDRVPAGRGGGSASQPDPGLILTN